MNNGRYLMMMDLGRLDYLVRVGLLRRAMTERWLVPVGSAHVEFKHSLRLFQKYTLHTKLIYWDHAWFYFRQVFRDTGDPSRIMGKGYVRALIRDKKAPLKPEAVIRKSLGITLPQPELDEEIRRGFGIHQRGSVSAGQFGPTNGVAPRRGRGPTIWPGNSTAVESPEQAPRVERLVREERPARIAPSSETEPSANNGGQLYGERASDEPIAIVGIGCRLPGGADSPAKLWQMLVDGRDCIVEIPNSRWDRKKFYHSNPRAPGKAYVHRAGLLDEDFRNFDPTSFGISPREAEPIDPQQRLLLEVAWEALEDAGIPLESLAGTQSGVFVGGFTLDNMLLQLGYHNRKSISNHTATSVNLTLLANRLSYVFDLRGPSMSIDTACSSSLVSIHQACQSLWSGESELALAGGVNAIVSPEIQIAMSKGQFLSPNGRCNAFGDQADGYVRAEGAGILVLKPLSAARRNGDSIHALIRATAVNQDGRTNGITVPNGEAQIDVMHAAYGRAGIDPSRVAYIEAHGTGTAAGDPVEATALGTVIGAGRKNGDKCLVSSVKTNMGHLEAASGVAGMVKTILCLQNEQVPPHLHLDGVNPKIDLDELGLDIPTQLTALRRNGAPLVAGVNSFGFGGTNAHVVLEQAPTAELVAEPESESISTRPLILPTSARSAEAASALAERYRNTLPKNLPKARDFCRVAGVRRSHHNYRLAFRGTDGEELHGALRAFSSGHTAAEGVHTAAKSLDNRDAVFVYTGMGPQWWAMGRELMATEPVYRRMLEQCDEVFRTIADWSLIEELGRSEDQSAVTRTDIAQPTNAALQIALTELWASWGVRPGAIVGHSIGEVGAAYASGALSLRDALAVSFHRSRLQRRLAGKGGMLAVGLSPQEARSRLDGVGDSVAVAAVNSMRSVTLAGDQAGLEKIAEALEQEGVFNRFLRVEVPYHSPKMDEIHDELIHSLGDLQPQTPHTRLYSTVTGQPIDSAGHSADYWWHNVRESVLFADAMANLIGDGYQVFVEVGPHPVLATSIRESLRYAGRDGVTLPSLDRKKPERQTMASSLAELYCLGADVYWQGYYGRYPYNLRIPTYPWQKKQYWKESVAARQWRLGGSEHPLLTFRSPSPRPAWQTELNASDLSFLHDHVVGGAVLFPGAGYIEIGLAIHHAISDKPFCSVEDIEFQNAATFAEGEDADLGIHTDPSTGAFEIYRVKEDEEWLLCARGTLFSCDRARDAIDLQAIQRRLPGRIDAEQLYVDLAEYGLRYGPCFRAVRQMWRGDGEMLAELELPDQVAVPGFHLHPVLLDAAFHSLIGAIRRNDRDFDIVPASVERVRFFSRPGRRAFAWGRLVEHTDTHILGHIELVADDGTVVAAVDGLRCQLLPTKKESPQRRLQRWVHRRTWLPVNVADMLAGHGLSEQERDAQPEQRKAQPRDSSKGADQSDEHWIVLGSRSEVVQSRGNGLLRGLQPLLGQRVELGQNRCFVVPPTWNGQRLQRYIRSLPNDVVTNVLDIRWLNWAADRESGDLIDNAIDAADEFLQTIQSMDEQCVERYYLMTSRAVAVTAEEEASLHYAAIMGMARTAITERPDLKLTLIDVAGIPGDEMDDNHRSGDRTVDVKSLIERIQSIGDEQEIAWRGDAMYALRLVNSVEIADAALLGEPEEPERVPASNTSAHELTVAKKGQLDTLSITECERRAPGAGEIEIAVEAVSLGFKDLMKALGIISDRVIANTFFNDGIGMEGAGTVVAVGDGCTEFRVGDRVCGIAPGFLRSHVTVPADYAVKIPDRLSCEQASNLIAFLTVYHGLVDVAQMQKGERILIHSASGGVGLAAIQIARQYGAEIFATAGSEEKRAFLRDQGIRYVSDSRTIGFVDEINEWTGGQGVDIVLNFSPGEIMTKSLSCLAPFGRFIEIGKSSFENGTALDLRPFNENLLYAAIDFDRILKRRPKTAQRVLLAVMKDLESGALEPLPYTAFPASRVDEGFRLMARAKHIGKIVISMADRDLEVTRQKRDDLLSPDATYMITGGLGGFGLEVAKWMVARGARHLALVSRRGGKSEEAQSFLARMRGAEIDVRAFAGDVSANDAVDRIMAEIARDMPALKGVVHAAMVLDDKTLADIDRQSLERVMGAKARGAWYLHNATRSLPLDFMVFFSSISALIGNAGQGSYVAANTFLDVLAQHRRHLGLPATSINWGVFEEVGVVARNGQIEKHLAQLGISGMKTGDALDALGSVMQSDTAQIGMVEVDWSAFARWLQPWTGHRKFAELVADRNSNGSHQQGGPGQLVRTKFGSLSEAERRSQLESTLLHIVGNVLRVVPDELSIQQPIRDLGSDSILAMEIVAAIESETGIELPAMKVISGPPIKEVADALMQQIDGYLQALPPPAESDAEPARQRKGSRAA
ncbi:MAG: SDR family NAD(P)-dependent oxidoreductase [Proteobacteria bacterium]|nr:SDR family NAD(P)-dependent oxidoreductase [Pseudomonadota bacterium]